MGLYKFQANLGNICKVDPVCIKEKFEIQNKRIPKLHRIYVIVQIENFYAHDCNVRYENKYNKHSNVLVLRMVYLSL